MNTISENEFTQLSPEDQEAAMAEIVDSCRQTHARIKDVVAQARAGISNGDYARAEAYLLSGSETGQEVRANKDRLLVTRLVGISCQKAALKEMINLYTKTGDHSRVQTSQAHLQALDAEVNEMRESAQASGG